MEAVYRTEGERGSHAGASHGVSVSDGCQGRCAHSQTRTSLSVRLSVGVIVSRTGQGDSRVPNVRKGVLACCRSCTPHNHTDLSRMLSFRAQLLQMSRVNERYGPACCLLLFCFEEYSGDTDLSLNPASLSAFVPNRTVAAVLWSRPVECAPLDAQEKQNSKI